VPDCTPAQSKQRWDCLYAAKKKMVGIENEARKNAKIVMDGLDGKVTTMFKEAMEMIRQRSRCADSDSDDNVVDFDAPIVAPQFIKYCAGDIDTPEKLAKVCKEVHQSVTQWLEATKCAIAIKGGGECSNQPTR
jgi:hypothetical protein